MISKFLLLFLWTRLASETKTNKLGWVVIWVELRIAFPLKHTFSPAGEHLIAAVFVLCGSRIFVVCIWLKF